MGTNLDLNLIADGVEQAILRLKLTRVGANYTESDLGLTVVVNGIALRSERRMEVVPAACKSIDTQVADGMVEVVAKMRPILTFNV